MPRTLLIDNTNHTRDKRFTFLTEDVVSAGTTFRVQSLVGFESLTTSSGQVLCIGEIGNERSEIRRTSQNDALSTTYNQVTLRDSLQFDHPQDTKIYIIDYDRIDIRWSSTTTGTKSTIRAYPIAIRPDQRETSYIDTTQTSGYYFVRFNETIGDTNSDYSDPIPYAGYDANTVFMIKKRAVDSLGEEIDGNIITHEFLNEALWEARRDYHKAPGKRPFRRKFNTDIGNVATGDYRVALPADVEKPYTAENVFGVRIGSEANMTYYDKKEWDFDWRKKPVTTLTSTYSVGARDLYVTTARDFTDSGVVSLAQTNVEYSAKSNSGGTLRISVDGSYSVDNGSYVYQNVSYGLPDKFTVWADPEGSAYIYFNMPVSTSYVSQNYWCDYYRTLVTYDSDADVLDEPTYDMYTHYLMAKTKHRMNKGATDITNDPDYKVWLFKRQEALSNEYVATDIRMEPSISHLPLPS